jgi:uncharacterized protein YebE (UPF0316 family)
LNGLIYTYVILPLLILVARVCDVTIGTIRIVFIARGNKLLAPILGFFEILIWLLAIRQILQNLENVFCYLAYAGGFAIGNLIGITIEEKLAYGQLLIRIVTEKDASDLIASLRRKGFGVTRISAEGSTGSVSVIYTIINRVRIEKAIRTINRFNPNAFYTIEDVRSVEKGIFPKNVSVVKRVFGKPPRFYRQLRIYVRQLLQRKSK